MWRAEVFSFIQVVRLIGVYSQFEVLGFGTMFNWMSLYYEIFVQRVNRGVGIWGRVDIFIYFWRRENRLKVVIVFLVLGRARRKVVCRSVLVFLVFLFRYSVFIFEGFQVILVFGCLVEDFFVLIIFCFIQEFGEWNQDL